MYYIIDEDKIWFNSFEEIPINVIKIYCDNNELIELPNWNLPELKYVECHNNKLTAIPNWNNLPKLEILHCYKNNLTEIPNWNLHNLILLDCSHNKLTTLPNWNFPNLTSLYCSDNILTELPNWNLPKLQILYCYENNLSALPNWNNLRKLDILHCYNNNLTALPNWNLPNLSYLDCSRNNLENLPDLDNLPFIEEIICYGNKIINIPVRENLTIININPEDRRSYFLQGQDHHFQDHEDQHEDHYEDHEGYYDDHEGYYDDHHDLEDLEEEEDQVVIIDENDFPSTCTDIFLQSEEEINDILTLNDYILINVVVNNIITSSNCISKENILKYYNEKEDNHYYECLGALLQEGKALTSFSDRNNPYIKLPLNGNYFIPKNSYVKLLNDNYKIYYIVPYMENGINKHLSHTIDWNNSYNSIGQRAFASADHCQNGSGKYVHRVAFCKDTIACIRSIISNIYS